MEENGHPKQWLSPNRLGAAEPLWRLAPTRRQDGRAVADFMMLIPGLGSRSNAARERVAALIREVCESYAGQVVFADVNYRLNLLWVSIDAVPGLAGQVAASIRRRVPEALLVGGHLGCIESLPIATGRHPGLWRRLRGVGRRAVRLCLPSRQAGR